MGFLAPQSERNSAIGTHEQTVLVELSTIYSTAKNLFGLNDSLILIEPRTENFSVETPPRSRSARGSGSKRGSRK